MSSIEDGVLIPGLPNDIAKLCLAHVPRLEFPVMSQVSKSWRSLLQSKEFHIIRRDAGTLEEWLYALIADPCSQAIQWHVLSLDCSHWKCLPPMPGPAKSGFGFAVIHGKLLVIGGSREGVDGLESVADVLKYDSALNSWSKVRSMYAARYDFACTVLGGCVYVVGGRGQQGKNLSSVEVYDPEKDEWNQTVSLSRARWGGIAFGIEGKVYIMGGRSSCTMGSSRHVSMYDPSVKEWVDVKSVPVMILSHVLFDKKVYCIEWKNERKLAVYDPSSNNWKSVPIPLTGSLSLGFCLGILNGKVFLFPNRTGSGCRTLVYDPKMSKGLDWQTSAICPMGLCIDCVTIIA
ncbi:hypothetical protein KP509_20G039000 [Ceratopteris richardii]|uniref:F-box domain-containing protein n=1 Tax=Ceratopteris richardii TaxID=49495 RepID=A0A8T2SHV0_CERRI|nr:hypothetical protein KP509_20G039000 [Ceratopteris richardii]